MRRLYRYRRHLLLISISLLLLLFFLYSHANNPQFGTRIDLGLIDNDQIAEASGIAASRKNPGVLWTHNDSGDNNRIFAINLKGQHLGEYRVGFIANRDLEDMAVGPGPQDGEQYIFLGDIGDNGAEYYIKYIYRIPEPTVDSVQIPVDASCKERAGCPIRPKTCTKL